MPLQAKLTLLSLLLPLSACMTFETSLPGVLDLRKPMAQDQNEPLEPKRQAFADINDSYFEGFVLDTSTQTPSQGEYVNGTIPSASDSTQSGATLYRRMMRQWFIIGLFPIIANPEAVTQDLGAELAKPGTRLHHIRITSGMDLVDFGRSLLAGTGVLGFLSLVPTRTTEVLAVVEHAPTPPAPAAQALPEPATDDSTPMGPVPVVPDEAITEPQGGQP